MSFKDIKDNLKTSYNSARTGVNLVEDFYVPVLSNANKYDRISCYFNSTSLALSSRGISKFIEHGGHMRLICGNHLSPNDYHIIDNADLLKDYVDQKFLDDYRSLEEGFKKDHIKLLGWMIANNLLEIKIAFNCKDPTSTIDELVHTKTGLLYDENNEIIFFNGSLNETASGWGSNLESIVVLNNWKYEELVRPHIEDFEDSWNNHFPAMKVMDFPEASKQELIKDAPSDEKELKELLKKFNKKSKDKKTPYKHQLDAVSRWEKNGKSGILEMATGTGKTYTAVLILKKLLSEEDVLTVIVCPYIHLVEQWKKELHALENCEISIFHNDSVNKWKKRFYDIKTRINRGVKFKKSQIILTTMDTFHTDEFTDIIKDLNKKMFLIVDEVHHVGSSYYCDGLLDEYDYKLGLSATPKRYMDPIGTNFIYNYFNGVVYTFSLQMALTLRDENGEHFLTKYNYYPKIIDIKYDESQNKTSAKNTSKKYEILNDILDELEKPIDHLIIFCSSKAQIKDVQNILDSKNIRHNYKFTSDEGLKLRAELLDDFDEGKLKALLAIKCLDEGVDVPSTDKVVIMSSSPNPSEYVQRRGRVLRKFPGKTHAEIYDLIVLPPDDSGLDEFNNTELNRLIDFIISSDNVDENFDLLKQWGLINEKQY